MKTHIIEDNCYVLIPEGHKLHGIDHYEIKKLLSTDLDLNFSIVVDDSFVTSWGLDEELIGFWMVGFIGNKLHAEELAGQLDEQ